MAYPRLAAATLIGYLTLGAGATPSAQSTSDTLEGNDNRRPAGTLADGTLTVRIYAARGDWRPERNEGPALQVAAFGEEGGLLATRGRCCGCRRGSTSSSASATRWRIA